MDGRKERRPLFKSGTRKARPPTPRRKRNNSANGATTAKKAAISEEFVADGQLTA